ncbi:transcriptional regulator [Spongiactinospora rosea]|uniref:Transcriptional regulator n=2 Tax=Spongiactinospora rosea TaxID=2248750 RepID=A0A366LXN0_9ACTN|nr:transcriptional regulator [Spongiactinospora rosea]
MPGAARDQTMLRRANELTVLAVLRDGTPRVMRDIADQTGLSWRTASVVTESLEGHGWLAGTEADAGDKRLGRPARRYRFRAEAGHVAGIDIGAHAICVYLADLAGTIVGMHRVRVSPGEPAADRLAAAEATVQAALDAAQLGNADVWAAAVGTTGIVGLDGVVTKSAVLPGWTGVDLGGRMGALLGRPVTVANDSNLAVLAEHWRGHRADTMIYLLVGVRLGTGLVIRGQLHRGAAGAAGEIGEIGEIGWSDAAQRLAAAAPGHLADLDGAARHVFAAARHQDPAAVAAVDRFATDIARGLTAMVLTIDPDVVVLGGGFAYAADLLMPRIDQRLGETCPHSPRLATSRLGDEAVGLGAVRLALDTVEQRITGLSSGTPLTPAAISASA